MTSTRNGLPFGMAAEQPPKAPLAHPPRTPEAHKAPQPNVPLSQLQRGLWPSNSQEPSSPRGRAKRVRNFTCAHFRQTRGSRSSLRSNVFGKQGYPEKTSPYRYSSIEANRKTVERRHFEPSGANHAWFVVVLHVGCRLKGVQIMDVQTMEVLRPLYT